MRVEKITGKTEDFLNIIINEGLFKSKFFSSKEKLRFNLENIFKDIDLSDKKVLDIGGGFGLYSFYAGINGAKEVICLEPEIEGSSESVIEKFHRLQELLKMDNVKLIKKTFQTFNNTGELFDIILSHYSINHLDETASMTVHTNDNAQKIYEKLAIKLGSISKNGALLIVCDCSSSNFFAHLGIKNPFAPTIEWHLHQPPEIWINILKSGNFVNPVIDWTSFGEFRKIGKILLGYRPISYFLNSHYCIKMTKQ